MRAILNREMANQMMVILILYLHFHELIVYSTKHILYMDWQLVAYVRCCEKQLKTKTRYLLLKVYLFCELSKVIREDICEQN